MMNVIWIVADTFRRDHMGAYGNSTIHTPSLDALAAGAVKFDASLFRRISNHAHPGGPSDWALDDVLHGVGAAA